MLALISWIISGLICGVLARLALIGSDPPGWLVTLSLCVAGSILGGYVGSLVWNENVEFLPVEFFLSVLGAILLLLIVHKIGRGAAIS